MVYRGKRSLRAMQKRDAKHYILQNGFQDHVVAETVCITKREIVLELLGKKYGMVFPDVVNAELGEVLVDSRGNGSLQRR